MRRLSATVMRLREPSRPLAASWLALRQQQPPRRGLASTARRHFAAGAAADADPLLEPPLACICDVMIVPAGIGPSFSKHVAECVQGFKDNPELNVQTHPMGTCLEGEWMEVMGAVKKATLQLHGRYVHKQSICRLLVCVVHLSLFSERLLVKHSGIARVTTTLKVGTRVDKQGYDMAYKLARIQEQLENLAGSHPANTRDERVSLEQLTSLLPDLRAAMDARQQKGKGESWDPQPLTDRIAEIVQVCRRQILTSSSPHPHLNLT